MTACTGEPEAADAGRSPRTRRLRLLTAVFATAASVVLIDQASKSWAVAALADKPVDLFWTLRLNLTFNPGVAFSMGTGLTPLITVAAIVLVGALLVFARHATNLLLAIALGLLLGGAIGNLVDRLFRGHGGAVVDFIDLQWWPVFNVADIGVSAGAVLLIVASLLEDRKQQRA